MASTDILSPEICCCLYRHHHHHHHGHNEPIVTLPLHDLHRLGCWGYSGCNKELGNPAQIFLPYNRSTQQLRPAKNQIPLQHLLRPKRERVERDHATKRGQEMQLKQHVEMQHPARRRKALVACTIREFTNNTRLHAL